MNPTKYTRTETCYAIQFDAQSDPATWPEGVHGRRTFGSDEPWRNCYVAVPTPDGLSYQQTAIDHDDKLIVKSGPFVAGGVARVWRVVKVIPADEWPGQAWRAEVPRTSIPAMLTVPSGGAGR